jgi:6-phosphogluconolactonase
MKTRIMATFLFAAALAQGAQYLMYVGTFTKHDSKGIYVFRFDDKTGVASPLGLAAEASNPSWLALHPNGKYLYVANEDDNYQGQKSGAVTAYTIDHATGKLAKINTVPSRGPGPCHVVVDHAGLVLFAANYAGGSVASFPIKLDGALGEASHFVQHTGSSVDPERQTAPHAHSANIAPDNRFVFIADLGLDEVLAYDLELRPHSTPFARVKPGLGPRHMVFSANGKFAYVMTEMGGSVTVFAYDVKQGTFKELNNISSLPPGYKGETSGAEIALHPTGKYLYVSNRGNSTISVFTVDKATGGLTLVDATPTGGKTPRNFAVDPSGNWLMAANQDTNNIGIFQIDRKTGKLTATGKTLPVSMPVCVTFTKAK